METNHPTHVNGVHGNSGEHSYQARLGDAGHELEWVITHTSSPPATFPHSIDTWFRDRIGTGRYANRGTRLEIYDADGPSPAIVNTIQEAFPGITIVVAGTTITE